MKLLCTGDLHLGAGADYGRAPGERLAEQQHVWTDICALAVNENVDAVLFAGDAFERRRPTPAEIMAFRAGLEILTDHDIRCVAIPGNHDVEAFDRPTGLDVLDGIATVYARPAVVDLEDLAIVTLPWTPPSRLVAARNGGDRDVVNREVSELLLETARGLRAQVPAHLPAILLLHWSVSGASLPSGLPVDGLREPVIPSIDLFELGFDFIVMGHIHKAQALTFDFQQRPGAVFQRTGHHAFYVGSPMPLNFGEAGVPHGVTILDTDARTSELVPIESRRFLTLDILIDELLEVGYDFTGWEIEGAIVKARYTATADQARRVDHAAIRQALYDAGAHKVYAIEATIERSERARVEVDESVGELDALDLWMKAQDPTIEPPVRDALQQLTSRYLTEVSA